MDNHCPHQRGHWEKAQSNKVLMARVGFVAPGMAGEWEVWQTSLHNPSFAKFAELCGGKGIQVTSADQLAAALKAAAEYAGPSIVEIITDVQLV